MYINRLLTIKSVRSEKYRWNIQWWIESGKCYEMAKVLLRSVAVDNNSSYNDFIKF